MRCFIAIDISDEAKKEIHRLQQNLPEAKMNFVKPENLHLTLDFLGELTDFQINKCKGALKDIEFQKFNAFLGNLGVFPSESYIRVLWIALEPCEIIEKLHEKIHDKLKNIIKLDKRFESHVTFARIKFIQDKKKFTEKFRNLKSKKVEFEANSFALKKSTLTRTGPIYEDIIRLNLS